MKVLVVGDSQAAGPPGLSLSRELQRLGHSTRVVGNPGRGPFDYVRLPELWSAFTGAIAHFVPDDIVLVFGSNDEPSSSLRRALERFRDYSTFAGRVWLSGPPRYADSSAQRRGEAIRQIHRQVFTDHFIDAYPWSGQGVARAGDGLHFTRESGASWGIPLANEILRRIAVPAGITRPGAP